MDAIMILKCLVENISVGCWIFLNNFNVFVN